MSSDPVIHLDAVTRLYQGGITALQDLTLKIPAGTCYGMIGRNGAGKSTALRLVMGMLRPHSGTVSIFGKDPMLEPEIVKADIGYLAEDHELPTALTGQDLFRLFADIYSGWDSALEKEYVDRLKLPTTRRIGTLSKGQKRQVALICAVAHKPKLLVLDEPGGGLDPVVRREFLETVIELLGAEGTTVLFSSHNLQEVERVASRIGILHNGTMILEENLDVLREGSCRVLIDTDTPIDATTITGCLRTVDRNGTCSLTMLCDEEQARKRIHETLGKELRQVQALSLEDLFVDLVGDVR